MAPASRPILAISEDGSVTRHLSKRAAAIATGIPAASVAFAATNLALRDGFLWKFEDDPRDVDMSRFRQQRNIVAPPSAAHVEQARDFVDALSGQVTTEESRAAARTVNERAAAPQDEADDEARALKRQRVRNEMEVEKARHANEMAMHGNEMVKHTKEMVIVQSELLNTLAAGAAPPALAGMLNVARHNLTIKCLAAMDAGGGTTTAPPVAAQTVAAARRITVQEFGREVLGLRGEQMATGRLSVVGNKLARAWKSQAGRGELVGVISDSGEKQWRRTFLENGGTQTVIFAGPLDDTLLANNRIKFSAAYLGTNEVGIGQAYDVWTYQFDQVEGMMRDAFQNN